MAAREDYTERRVAQLEKELQAERMKNARLEGELAAYRAMSNPDKLETPSEKVAAQEKKKSPEHEEVMRALWDMTPRMHATLQMLLRGASNREIGERFGTTENGIKITVYAIMRKLNVNRRSQVVVKVSPVMQGIDPDFYLSMTGIPINWDKEWTGKKNDPYYEKLKARPRSTTGKKKAATKKKTTSTEQRLAWLRDADEGKPPVTFVGSSPSLHKRTLSDVIDQYLSARPDMSHTARGVINRLRDHAGHLDIQAFDNEAYEEYLKVRWSRPVASSTRRREMTSINALFSFAYKKSFISKVPYVELPPDGEHRERWLTKEEVSRLLAAAAKTDQKFCDALDFLLRTGARYNEFAQLRWQDVSSDQKNVVLRTRK
ncbi:Transcriptional regulatory protein DegU (Protease production enhancer protein), partial [Durusdinium trenchii]